MATDIDGWQFWIDRGGTFTDVVARAPDGKIHALKLLSDRPDRYDDAALDGIQRIRGATSAPLAAVKMGTTVGTNALLERQGAPTALVVTAGLRDVLRIGTQQRPDIFALDIELPEMLYSEVVEAAERLAADGGVLEPLDTARLKADLAAIRERGIDSIAVALLHAYRFPAHELRIAAVARELGFKQISLSHQVSPLMKLVPRGDTTVVDAYLTPVLDAYIDRLRRGLEREAREVPLLFMQSHGGLVAASEFRGKDCVLSGPAGGVVGMAETAHAAGFQRVIGFDMGGTSTDVSLYEGRLERTTSAMLGGIRIAAPMLQIHTVAAGGGSRLKFSAERLQVGPESAGAAPGPACYRNGGPLTITDANVLLGRIQADFFPAVFGPAGDQPLDVDAVKCAFAELARRVSKATGSEVAAEVLAAGFLTIAVERMASAIKEISIRRGHDVTRFVLVCFGGAGGQHACQVADALGIETIMIHPLAGVLSAFGMGVADLRALRHHAVERSLTRDHLADLTAVRALLEQQAREDLIKQQVGSAKIDFECRLALKVSGTDTTLPIDWRSNEDLDDLLERFKAAHERHFGFAALSAGVTAESIEVEAIGRMRRPDLPLEAGAAGASREPLATRPVWDGEGWAQVGIYERRALPAEAVIEGPAIVAEPHATTVLERGWRAEVTHDATLLLKRATPRQERQAATERSDPVMLEVFNNLFMHIASEMGVVLQNTAHSVNIKERLDFSCALFDAAGRLIANAPHMPVHLGSMGASVRTVLAANGADMQAGDSYMQNAPYNGGTHLPDITVVTPVFDATGATLRFVVANRAHHADIGGMTPGSMPAMSRSIEEEGVVFDNMLIVRQGRLRESDIRRSLSSGPYPARNPDQNIADLKAQLAANRKGIAELERMVERFGLDVVHAYMDYIRQNAEAAVRGAIDALEDGQHEARLDNGAKIRVAVRIDHAERAARIDFTGSSPTSDQNVNAPAAVAQACVLYVFRALVAEDIPLNEGCLRPLTIVLPDASLVKPEHPAAVVAGNVETSQCITDALLAALHACAASQGTMNNFTFGDSRYQYYETLAGGAGAGPGFNGASAVHTHMTNSRLTDIEVLEWRYPVRIRRFELREGSGGSGRWHGGDGLIREFEFLEELDAAILSNRRQTPPFGLAGGGAGACGRNTLLRASGEREKIGPAAELHLMPGDRFRIETPGGGGYGSTERLESWDGSMSRPR